MRLHWLHYWMMLHTTAFWGLVVGSFFKLEGVMHSEWATLIQLWIWNMFAYLYVAFVNFLRIMKSREAPAAIGCADAPSTLCPTV